MQIEQISFPFSPPPSESFIKKSEKKLIRHEVYEEESNLGLGIWQIILLAALVVVIVKVSVWVWERWKQQRESEEHSTSFSLFD